MCNDDAEAKRENGWTDDIPVNPRDRRALMGMPCECRCFYCVERAVESQSTVGLLSTKQATQSLHNTFHAPVMPSSVSSYILITYLSI